MKATVRVTEHCSPLRLFYIQQKKK